MTVITLPNMLLPTMPDLALLRMVAAAAYGIPEGDVAVGDYWNDANPFPSGKRVYLNLWNAEDNGDLPVIFDQEADEILAAHMDLAMRNVAVGLGMMVVTIDSSTGDPFIHLPDGTGQRRVLDESIDGGFSLPADLKSIAVTAKAARAA